MCKRSLCGRPVVRAGLCSDHLAEFERGRGQRYDSAHRRRSESMRRRAVGTVCPRCGELMTAEQSLELDHTTPLRVDRRSVGDVVVHAWCNPKGTHPDNYRRH